MGFMTAIPEHSKKSAGVQPDKGKDKADRI